MKNSATFLQIIRIITTTYHQVRFHIKYLEVSQIVRTFAKTNYKQNKHDAKQTINDCLGTC